MPCEYIIFGSSHKSSTLDIENGFVGKGRTRGEAGRREKEVENLVFMAAMSMKIYVQQIRRFISIDGYYIHFFNIPL